MDKCITVDNLSFTFPGSRNPALDRVTLEIGQGEFVCILGKNGSGKSTLLRCLSGTLDFDCGTIVYDLAEGRFEVKPRSGERCLHRDVGIVFQEDSLWPHWSVLRNISQPLVDRHRMKISLEEAERKAKDWLAYLGVDESYWSRSPGRLSGGNRRKVAIARTLAMDPSVLLLDEMTAFLDPEISEEILMLLKRQFVDEPDRTVLMITHRIDFLNRFADRIVVLDEGKVVQVGDFESVIANPGAKSAGLVRVIVDPMRSEWRTADKCLRSVVNLTDRIAYESGFAPNVFPLLGTEVAKLLCDLEPETGHLILLITRDVDGSGAQLKVRAVATSGGFRVSGEGGSRLSAWLNPGGIVRDNQKVLEEFPDGTPFESAKGRIASSLIEQMFRGDPNTSEYRDGNMVVPGVWHQSVKDADKNDQLLYCEFSGETRHVYLFPMERNGTVVGVLSIDTCGEEKWPAFAVRYLKLVANVGAIAIDMARVSSNGDS